MLVRAAFRHELPPSTPATEPASRIRTYLNRLRGPRHDILLSDRRSGRQAEVPLLGYPSGIIYESKGV
jgi:hypothetical protein